MKRIKIVTGRSDFIKIAVVLIIITIFINYLVPAAGILPVSGNDVMNLEHYNNLKNITTDKQLPQTPSYTVAFTESGLPAGTAWSVTLNSVLSKSTTNSITFTEPNGTYSYTISPVYGYVANNYSGNVTVNGASKLISVTWKAVYTVTFTESGLSAGTYWSVVLGGTTNFSNGNSINFTEVNGTYNYAINPVYGYTANITSGYIYVQGANASLSVKWTPVYTVTFTESGLSAGTYWSVVLGGTTNFSNSNSINFTEINGAYNYTINSVHGYVANISSGTIYVQGANVSLSVKWTPVYTVTFTENGLPPGTGWSVILNASTRSSNTNTISFAEIDGTYTYNIVNVSGYSIMPSYAGTVTVNNKNKSVNITYQAITIISYTITFNETGLPVNTLWTVTLNGTSKSRSSNEINFTEGIGSYTYSIMPVSGYHTTNYNGIVSVSGTNVTITVKWNRVLYSITFVEEGLQAGTNWSITLNNITEYGTGSRLIFMEPNGTYSYTAGNMPAYTVTNDSGTVHINGKSVNYIITYSATVRSNSILASSGIIIFIYIVILILVIIAILYIFARRKGTSTKNSIENSGVSSEVVSNSHSEPKRAIDTDENAVNWTTGNINTQKRGASSDIADVNTGKNKIMHGVTINKSSAKNTGKPVSKEKAEHITPKEISEMESMLNAVKPLKEVSADVDGADKLHGNTANEVVASRVETSDTVRQHKLPKILGNVQETGGGAPVPPDNSNVTKSIADNKEIKSADSIPKTEDIKMVNNTPERDVVGPFNQKSNEEKLPAEKNNEILKPAATATAGKPAYEEPITTLNNENVTDKPGTVIHEERNNTLSSVKPVDAEKVADEIKSESATESSKKTPHKEKSRGKHKGKNKNRKR